MPPIEHRIEEPPNPERDYAGREFTDTQLAQDKHRAYVGGHWDSIGRLQFDFLRDDGLRPDDRFLDVGCGSLRAGRHLIDYLEPGHYYGIDINPAILQAGYDHELTDDQRERLPLENLRATNRFDADFGVTFDIAIAQSVFTHISLNSIRLCLSRIAQVMRPGGVFYATFFEEPPETPLDKTKGRRRSDHNTYWHYRSDMRWAAAFSPWEVTYLGNWDHPRGQKMLKLTRTEHAPASNTVTVAHPAAVRLIKAYRRIRVKSR